MNFNSNCFNGTVFISTELLITQFADQVNMRLISMMISNISRILKLLKYLYGASMSIFFCIIIIRAIWCYSYLDLSDLESLTGSFCSSLQYCSWFPVVYHCMSHSMWNNLTLPTWPPLILLKFCLVRSMYPSRNENPQNFITLPRVVQKLLPPEIWAF